MIGTDYLKGFLNKKITVVTGGITYFGKLVHVGSTIFILSDNIVSNRVFNLEHLNNFWCEEDAVENVAE